MLSEGIRTLRALLSLSLVFEGKLSLMLFEDTLVADYVKAVRLEEEACRSEYLEQAFQLSSGNKQGPKTRWDEGNASTRIDPGRVAQQAVGCIIESFRIVSAMRDELHRVKRLLSDILPRHFSKSSLAEPGDPMGEVLAVYEMGTKALRSLREGAVVLSHTLNVAVPMKPAVMSLHAILLKMNEEAQKSIDEERRTHTISGRDPPHAMLNPTVKHDALCVLEWKASSLPQTSPRYPDPHRRLMDIGNVANPQHHLRSGGEHVQVKDCAEAVVDQTRQLIECLHAKTVIGAPLTTMPPPTSPRKPQQSSTQGTTSTPRRTDSARAHRAALQQLRKAAQDPSDIREW